MNASLPLPLRGLPAATCPKCHTAAAVSSSAIEAGADWRCVRCGQHWDARRLLAVASYAAWRLDHDGEATR